MPKVELVHFVLRVLRKTFLNLLGSEILKISGNITDT
jgi:hypothetical protein